MWEWTSEWVSEQWGHAVWKLLHGFAYGVQLDARKLPEMTVYFKINELYHGERAFLLHGAQNDASFCVHRQWGTTNSAKLWIT